MANYNPTHINNDRDLHTLSLRGCREGSCSSENEEASNESQVSGCEQRQVHSHYNP